MQSTERKRILLKKSELPQRVAELLARAHPTAIGFEVEETTSGQGVTQIGEQLKKDNFLINAYLSREDMLFRVVDLQDDWKTRWYKIVAAVTLKSQSDTN